MIVTFFSSYQLEKTFDTNFLKCKLQGIKACELLTRKMALYCLTRFFNSEFSWQKLKESYVCLSQSLKNAVAQTHDPAKYL